MVEKGKELGFSPFSAYFRILGFSLLIEGCVCVCVCITNIVRSSTPDVDRVFGLLYFGYLDLFGFSWLPPLFLHEDFNLRQRLWSDEVISPNTHIFTSLLPSFLLSCPNDPLPYPLSLSDFFFLLHRCHSLFFFFPPFPSWHYLSFFQVITLSS